MLLTVASVVAATVPMVAMLGAVWWLDRYDREPIWLITTVFAWGALAAVFVALPATLVADTAVHHLLYLVQAPAWAIERATGVVVAPLAEEPIKGAVLLLVLYERHFDNMTDGFVYGAAVGLGFGMAENLGYFLSLAGDPAWGSVVILRTCYSAVMHAMASAVLGAALGHARFRRRPILVAWALLGLVMALGIHGAWNALASSPSEGLWLADRLLLPIELLGVVAVFELCVFDEARAIRTELSAEADAGVMPVSHPEILASWLRRSRAGWLPAHIDADRYVRAATDLAMRKRQVRELGPRAPLAFRAEVELLRRELRAMNASSPS